MTRMLIARVACLAALLASVPVLAEESKPSASRLAGLKFREPVIPDSVQGQLRLFNEQLSKDLPPAENAVVYLLDLFPEEDLLAPPLRATALSMLGIAGRPADSPKYMSPGQFASELLPEDAAQLREQFLQTRDRPWTSARLPLAARYFEENAACLDSLEAISGLRGYYAPVLSEELPPRILSADLGVEMRLNMLGGLLAARAMQRSGEGKAEEAVRDLLTCHRLARLLSKGSPMDVSYAKAHLIDSYACHGAQQLLASGRIPAYVAESYFAELHSMPDLSHADVAADRGERAIILQELEIVKDAEASIPEYLSIPPGKKLPNLTSTRLQDVDWKAAEEKAMEIHDRSLAVLRLTDREALQLALVPLEEAYLSWSKKADEFASAGEDTIDLDLPAVSHWIGETVARSLRGSPSQRRLTDERARTRRSIVMAGLALVVHAERTGGFPRTLGELDAKVVSALVDGHSGQTIEYLRRSDGSVMLRSLGANRTNDAGRLYSDDTLLDLPDPNADRILGSPVKDQKWPDSVEGQATSATPLPCSTCGP